MFFDSAMVGLGISPASVVGDDFADRGHHGVAELGMRGEANEDGLMDGGPAFVFGGRIVGVRWDEEDLVLRRVCFAISEAGRRVQWRCGWKSGFRWG